MRRAIPCLPVSLHYATPRERWGPAYTVCWWGGMGLWLHLWRLLGMRGVTARVRWSSAPLMGLERKELAGELRSAMRAHFDPIQQGPAPPDFPWPRLVEEGCDEPSTS